MITLHDYWRSSASYRVRIALGLSGLEWESISVNLMEGAQRSPSHMELNPQGLVPVVWLDGEVMTQSLAIIEYLDETRNMGLLGDTPLDGARIRALSHAIAMEIHPVCNLLVAKYAVAESGGGITMESWIRHFMARGLVAFERMVGDSDYCYGSRVTLADICLVPQLYNARRWGVDLEPMPGIRRIEAALEKLPAFAAAHPDFCANC
ncbi:maleylacetoacetate isomerase [Tropicimonas sp.]|uniref:maleylacetoacetate isomerase n=1 Tax=Tropicimonas sp. TaxID=2067044 RepID=UPI003A898FC5